MKNPRADSFSLYMNIVGDIILKNMLPKTKIALALSHFEVIRDPWISHATFEQF